jgi:hypothetical protein
VTDHKITAGEGGQGDADRIIIYNSPDGKAQVALMARDGAVWLNQNQMAELFGTSKQGVGQHISNILKENELPENSVVKKFFTTAADGKTYHVTYYALAMVLAVGFRVRGKRGTQFRDDMRSAVSRVYSDFEARRKLSESRQVDADDSNESGLDFGDLADTVRKR